MKDERQIPFWEPHQEKHSPLGKLTIAQTPSLSSGKDKAPCPPLGCFVPVGLLSSPFQFLSLSFQTITPSILLVSRN